MFSVNDDLSIYITRGDTALFNVTATMDNGERYVFNPGDVVRFKVTEKKSCENVVIQKDFAITSESEAVEIFLTEDDTKIGDVISKPADYWYEIELNPFTNPQTLVGYDDEGAKILKLFPEGKDLTSSTKQEDVPVVDAELDLTSDRPVQNQAVSRALVNLEEDVKNAADKTEQSISKNASNIDKLSKEFVIEKARIDNMTTLKEGSTTGDAELQDIRVGANGYSYSSAGTAVREQINEVKENISDTIGWVAEENIAGSTLERIIELNTGGSWEGNVYTSNGVSYTFSFDEFNKLESVELSGTASSNSAVKICATRVDGSVKFYIKGCPITGSESSYFQGLYKNSVRVVEETGVGKTYTAPEEDYYTLRVYVMAGTNVDGVIFNPYLSHKEPQISVQHQMNKKIEAFGQISGITQGAIKGDTGLDDNTIHFELRCRTSFIRVNGIQCKVTDIINSDAYTLYAFYYDGNKNYIGKSKAWLNRDEYFSIPENTEYMRLLIRNQEQKCTPQDFEGLIIKWNEYGCNYEFDSQTNTFTIITEAAKLTVSRRVDSSINLDSWRLYSGYVKNGGTWSTMWVNSDAEGPIKIDNEADYISGYHGDEVVESVEFRVDNTVLDINGDIPLTPCKEFVFEQISNVYRDASSTLAFIRTKKITINEKGYSVQQLWKALIPCNITRGGLALFQCYKKILKGWDTNCLIPLQSNDQDDRYVQLNKNTTVGNMYLDDVVISISAEVGQNEEGYKPQLKDFRDQNRLKFYFDMYNGKDIKAGEEIVSKFSVGFNKLTN